jgi:hypothetical protein
MIIEITPDQHNSWSLYVDGRLRVAQQSHTICANIREHLERPNRWDGSECSEVAERIRERIEE